MKVSNLLINNIHHGMVGAVVATELWTDAMAGRYNEVTRKAKNIAILMLAQHYLKKFIPALSPSSRVMVGIACYDSIVYRKNSQYQALLVAFLTAGIAIRSLALREHGFLDLAVATVAGKGFGILWNYSFS